MRISNHLALPAAILIQAACSASIVAPSVAAPALLRALNLGSVAIGIHMSLLFTAAMFAIQYSPALIRRMGPMRVSQWALLTSACGLLLVGMPHIALATLGTILIGIGSAPIMPASSEMLVRITPPDRLAFAFSVKQTGVPMGGIFAAFAVPQVLVWSNGFAAMCTIAGLTVLAAAAAQGFRAGMDRERDPSAGFPRVRQLMQPVASTLLHKDLRPLAWLGVALATTQFSLTSYLVTYLSMERGWSIISAGFALAVAQAAGAVGRLAWGWLSDSSIGEQRTLRLMVLGMAGASLGLPMMPADAATAAALGICVLFGLTAVGWTGLIFAAVARVAPPGQLASATAGVMSFNYLGAMAGPALFGLAAKAMGSHGLAYGALGLALVVLAAAAFRTERSRP